MKVERSRRLLQALLDRADVTIDGDRPWDIRVSDPRMFARVLAGGSLALGDSYMDGWWECEALDGFFDRVLGAGLDSAVQKLFPAALLSAAADRLFNPQRPSRAFEVGRRHYDLGNDLFHAMLDRRMIYSCALWEAAATLDEAQEAKLDLICRKLLLEPGMRVLDIGCGWGGFARYAAEAHGVRVTGVTVSERQLECAREVCRGLPVEIRLQDYREVEGRFDRVVSVGMFEHVGVDNYRAYMQVVHRCLGAGGICLLHTIGGNTSVRAVDPWVRAHIFPNSMLPSAAQIAAAAERLFVIEDWQSLGPHYDRTLMAWHANFVAAWARLRAAYDERFFRMWRYYLLASAGSFRARSNQLWQIVFSKGGLRGGYRPPRNGTGSRGQAR
jgi:cyclopropane-fatty-acyl-phospholipid synthase